MVKSKYAWVWIVGIILLLMYTTGTGFFKKQALPNGAECNPEGLNNDCASGWCVDDWGWEGTCGANPYGTPGGETATQLSIEKSKIKQLSELQMIPYTCILSSECIDKDASCTSLKLLEQQGFLPKTAAGITGTMNNVVTGAAGLTALCGLLTTPTTFGTMWIPCVSAGAGLGWVFTKISDWFKQHPDDVGLCVKSGGFCVAGISNIVDKVGLDLGCQGNTIAFFAVIFLIFMMFMMMSKR